MQNTTTKLENKLYKMVTIIKKNQHSEKKGPKPKQTSHISIIIILKKKKKKIKFTYK
jgi:hypothetical protein